MIGYAMVYAVAVGAPILLAASAVAGVRRRHGHSERGVWIVALTLGLLLPALALGTSSGGTSSSETPIAPSGAPTAMSFWIAPPILVLEQTPAPSSNFDADEMLLAMWLLASLLLATHWAGGSYRLSRASRSWRRETVDGVSTWVTDRMGPAVWGVLRPRVLTPRWMLALPEGPRTLVLRHELEHIRAGDPVLIVFARLARILTPWNPVVWALTSRLLRAVELDCDRRVLAATSDVGLYGRTLLDVARLRGAPFLAATAFAESETSFRQRILALTTPARPVSRAAITATTMIAVLLFAGMIAIPVPAVREATLAQVRANPTNSGSVEWTPPARFLNATQVTLLNADEMNAALFQAYNRIRPDRTGWEMQLWLRVGETGRVIESRTRWAYGITPAEQAALAAVYFAAQFRPVINAGAPDPFWLWIQIGAAPVNGAPARVQPTVLEPQRATPSTPVTAAQQVNPRDYPLFTPFSVQPELLNGPEIAPALSAAVPAETRAAGAQISAVLWVYVGLDGTVQRAVVQTGSGNDVFDRAVLDVARLMRFSPALNRDQRVPVWVQVPLRFGPVTPTN
jgi:TonB family protein